MPRKRTNSSRTSPRTGKPSQFSKIGPHALLQKPSDGLSDSGRDPTERAQYATRPRAYLRDILGIEYLSPDQEQFLENIVTHDRELTKAANAVGKSFLLGAVGVWWMDAVAAQLDEEGEEQGAVWILTAPDQGLIKNVLWANALAHMRRAAKAGYKMPGQYSELSVLWKVREDWRVESLSPPKIVGQQQQHGASGRHHRNLLITMDEGPGIEAARYHAAEGMASGLGNKIIVAGNPTEVVGPFVDRANDGSFHVTRISALDHPNVILREEVVAGGAITHRTTDKRVRIWCIDRGPLTSGKIEPDPAHFDFLYRLHPWVGDNEKASEIPDPRPSDETLTIAGTPYRVLGHQDADIHVFRPDGRFLPTVMGHFPLEGQFGLFPASYIDKAVELWMSLQRDGVIADLERGGYHAVGLDAAEDGGDDPIAAPVWKYGDIKIVDRLTLLRKGLDHQVAGSAYQRFGRTLYIVDAIGVGSGVQTRLVTDHGCKDAQRFKASEAAYPDLEAGEPDFVNTRAAGYWRLSVDLKNGRLALPPDAELKVELMAQEWKPQKGKMLMVPKKDIKDIIGRSPDRAEAVMMACYEDFHHAQGGAFYTPIGGRAKGRRQPPRDYSFYRRQG